jgi:hypothetical protein
MRRVAAVGYKAVDSSATSNLRTATNVFRETVSQFLNTDGIRESKNNYNNIY